MGEQEPCSKCGTMTLVSEMPRHRYRRRGEVREHIVHQCKSCWGGRRRGHNRASYGRHRERRLVAAQNRYENLKQDPRQFMLQRVGQRARRRGVEFTITESDISIPVLCPVLGLVLRKPGDGIQHDDTMTIDRFDSTKGYVPGNVNVMSLRANRLKNYGTVEEFEKLLEWMRKQ